MLVVSILSANADDMTIRSSLNNREILRITDTPQETPSLKTTGHNAGGF